MSSLSKLSNVAKLTIVLFCHNVYALSGSMCKRTSEPSGTEPNFCLTVTTNHNSTANNGDVHISFTHDRELDSALGWIAIGIGSIMDGSLMFVMYGDPQGGPPTLGVRTANFHEEPVLAAQQKGLDIQMISRWSRLPDTHERAIMEISCYGCSRWPGTDISVAAKEQSFIWASNSVQDFGGSYLPDAKIDMHSEFGTISIDMDAEGMGDQLTATSNSDILTAGASGVGFLRSRLWKIHALVTTSAFLVLIPLGALAIRVTSSKSFTTHWVLQIIAGGMALSGIGIGFASSRSISVAHQYIGCAVGLMLVIQPLLGYRHHVLFLRIRQETWLSHAHKWLGRCLMLAGLLNIPLGLALSGYGTRLITVIAVAEVMEVFTMVIIWGQICYIKPPRSVVRWSRNLREPRMEADSDEGMEEETFALDSDEDDKEGGDDLQK